MKVVTCISDVKNYGFTHLLKGSCDHFGLPLVVLEHHGHWDTFRYKDARLLQYLEDLPKHEIVLFTDGYDAMFMCSESEIMAKYRAGDRALIFTAEKNCWPYAVLASEYLPSPTQFRYLNCGGFIGEAGLIAELLTTYRQPPAGTNSQEVDQKYLWSNQYYWTRVYMRHQDVIALDYQADIFLEVGSDGEQLLLKFGNVRQPRSEAEQSAFYAQECERLRNECLFVDGRVLHRDTRTTPCQVHFNGPVVKKIAFDNHFEPVMPWLKSAP
jgi:hypothetical protein